MKRTRLIVLISVFLLGVALTAFAALGVAGDGKTRLASSVRPAATGFRFMQATRTLHASAKKAPGVKVIYLATSSQTLAPSAQNKSFLTCPRSHPHAISGFFDADSPLVVLSGSLPINRAGTEWGTAVTNLGVTPQTYIRGIVCAT